MRTRHGPPPVSRCLQPATRARALLAAAFVMGITMTAILAGCGGTGNTGPTTAAAPRRAAEHEFRATSSGVARVRRTARAQGAGADFHPPRVSRRLFTSKANAVCQVMQGAAPPLRPGTSDPSRNALAQAATLRQTINVLLSLRPSPPPSLRPHLARLLTSLERLQQLDTTFRSDQRSSRGSFGIPPDISAATQRAAQQAIAAGLPDCSPIKPGTPQPSIPSRPSPSAR